MSELNQVTRDLLSLISDWDGKYKGAYNIQL